MLRSWRTGILAADRWLDDVPFTRDGFVDYLMTQSTVAAAIEGGEPEESVRGVLGDLMGPFFAGGPRRFAFTASYQLLQLR